MNKGLQEHTPRDKLFSIVLFASETKVLVGEGRLISEINSFYQDQIIEILHRHQVLHSTDRDGAFGGKASAISVSF